MENLLELRHITKRFPGVLALDNISVGFRAGEIHALAGENGAGKSTLMKILAGAYVPDAGEIIFEGKTYSKMSPHLARALNIEIVYQEFNQFPTLSVAENLFAGELSGRYWWVDRPGMEREAGELLRRMGVAINPKAMMRSLSVAEQQLVEIARAIRKGAKLLVLDEPTAPLTGREVEILFELIRTLKAENVTIIYISHRLEEIFELTDRVTIMRDGRVVSTHNTKDINKDGLIKGMIGRDMSELFPPRAVTPGKTVFEARNLCGGGDACLNFTVGRGEILGVAGLVGSGRTEMARLVFGADPIEGGEILMEGKTLKIRSPKDALRAGIAYVSEDRKRDGLFLKLAVDKNIASASIRQFCRFGVVNDRKLAAVVGEQVQALRIVTPSLRQLVQNLSGGNQQKVVLAKWLISDVRLMIFDEPTRGIDVGAKQEIYNIMNALTAQGISIIMISSDMEEVLQMSDRILVLYEGRQMDILGKEDFSEEKVMTLASGYSN